MQFEEKPLLPGGGVVLQKREETKNFHSQNIQDEDRMGSMLRLWSKNLDISIICIIFELPLWKMLQRHENAHF